MSERFMVGGFDRRNLTRRVLAQIVQEVGRVIPAYAFHDLGEHKPGLADRDTADRGIEIAARLARHGAKFDRIVTGLRPKFKFRRPFGKVFGNATDPIALETSVKRGAAESRDPRLKVSQAGVEREACACGRRR